jgi:hypothetical protein
MSAKGIALQGRTSGRPVPVEIEAFAAGAGGQPHAFKPGIAAAVGHEHRGARRDIFDVRHEATGADDAAAVEIFDRQRRGRLVVAGRKVERFVLIDSRGAMGRVGSTEAMVERGLQRQRVVRCAVPDRTEPTILDADRLEVGEQQHRRRLAHAAVVSAVHVVPPSVLM